VQIQAALKTGARMSGGGARLGKALVALQIALSLVLLVGAAVFLRTLVNLVTLDPGFDRHNLIVADVQSNGPRDEQLHRAWEELRRHVSAIPGVESASLSGWSLFSVINWTGLIRVPGKPLDPKELQCYFMKVSTSYFRTMHTWLIDGRDFEPRDFEPPALPVAVVNQTLARRHFLNESPIGKTFGMEEEPTRWIQVIGIVQDTKYDNLRKPAAPLIYLPCTLGSTVGTAVALATMRLVASLLFGLAPHDPAAMLIGVGVLVAVALTAAFVPERRASQVHPMAALRHE